MNLCGILNLNWSNLEGAFEIGLITGLINNTNKRDPTRPKEANNPKSFNILELDNGHFAAQPNNRVLFYDKSLTPAKTLQPDFKVSTEYYSVENKTKWTAGDDTSFFYELKEQK